MEFLTLLAFISLGVLVIIWSDYTIVGKTVHGGITSFLILSFIIWIIFTEKTIDYTEIHTATINDTHQTMLFYYDVDNNIHTLDDIYNPENVTVMITIPRKGSISEVKYKVVPIENSK